MGENNNSKNNGEALRAGDILPPYDFDEQNENQSHDFEIPTFNLAEDIMAEQRKLTANLRKNPRSGVEQNQPVKLRIEEVARPSKTTPEKHVNPAGENDSIIREIVARDIDRLCGRRAAVNG